LQHIKSIEKEGVVEITYTITKNCAFSNIKVSLSGGKNFDKSAINAVSNMGSYYQKHSLYLKCISENKTIKIGFEIK